MNIENRTESLKYRPEIDGLRAISVIAVILFHANLFMTGGYVGVDIFFVISGYLITSIILAEIEQNRFSIIMFWERRVRRIFPAVVLMQIMIITLGILLYLPKDLDHLFKSSVYLSCNLPNVNAWRSIGYFSDGTTVKPLLHTWSLGVEEQFYIVYPFLLLILCRYFRKNLIGILMTAGVLSLCFNIYQTYFGDVATAFYLLPSRTWELMSGCILVVRNPFRGRSKYANESLSALGLTLMILSMVLMDEKAVFPGLWAIPPVLGACIFIGSNSDRSTFTGRILSRDFLVIMGKMSFSLYLWHWPLIVFPALYFPDHRALRLAFVALTFPISFLSWKLVEEPIRRKRLLASRKSIFGFYISLSCIMIGLSLFGVLTRGMSFRANLLPVNARDKLLLADDAMDATISPLATSKFFAGKREYLGDRSGKSPKFLIWGDSHAVALGGSFNRVAERLKIAGWIVALHGNPPKYLMNQEDPIVNLLSTLDSIRPVDETREMLNIMNSNKIDDLILVVRWDLVPDSQRITSFLDLVGDLSPHTKVFVLDQFPMQNYGPRVLAYQAILDSAIGEPFRYRTTNLNDYANLRKHVEEAMSNTRNRNAVHVSVGDYCFDSNGQSKYKEGNRILYFDDDHLSRFGSEHLFDPVAERILESIIGSVD